MSWSWLPKPFPKMVAPPTCSASSSTAIRKVIRLFRSGKSEILTSDRHSPSIYVPYWLIRKCFKRPYWLWLLSHQPGLYLPRISEKFPGHVHVPRFFEQETNGLLSYTRKPKTAPENIRKILEKWQDENVRAYPANHRM